MAIYHLSAKTVNRAQGHNAVAASAYRARTNLRDQNTGKLHHFRPSQGTDEHRETFMMFPPGLPQEAQDKYRNMEILWSEAEAVEVSINTGKPIKNATIAREIEVALPIELSPDKHSQILERFVYRNFAESGMIAQVSIHEGGGKNPHAHIMLTTRKYDHEKGTFNTDKGHKSSLDWDKKQTLKHWRKEWAIECNRELPKHQQIDHRTLDEQGIKREPQVHEGRKVRALEEDGIVTEIGSHNMIVREQALQNQITRELHRLAREKSKPRDFSIGD